MLSNLTRVGCAHTHCLYPDRIERYLVCNYIQSQYTDNYMVPYVQSATSAVDCPNKKNGNLCDCGNTICNYDKSEYLEPATCTCKSSKGKRSLNKRDVDDIILTNDHPQHVAAPKGKISDLPSISKRDLTGKGSLRKIFQN